MNPIARFMIGAHMRLYRATSGRLGGKIQGLDLVLLSTTGKKSGKTRTVPLGSFVDNGDRFIVASNAGADKHPAWFVNLSANPDVTVQLGARVYRARAVVTSGEERARLWQQVAREAPGYQRYTEKTSREIPIVRLKEVASS
jgi:deazaflavin-dependent oxidoreductase (nitroreductase family)